MDKKDAYNLLDPATVNQLSIVIWDPVTLEAGCPSPVKYKIAD
jgi:hypothetical protein